MDIFQHLHVSATADRMAEVVGQIERSMPPGWTRDRLAEERAQAGPFSPGQVYCFACLAEGRTAGLVILAQKDPETFHVSNIIPVSRRRLDRTEYNAILTEFSEHLLRPAAEHLGLKAALSSAAVGLEHWMSAATAEKLQRFSLAANKGVASSNPSDRQRWNDFVLSAHQEHSSMDAAALKRWLVEVEGWAADVAEQLAIAYESGRELLTYAEGHRRSA